MNKSSSFWTWKCPICGATSRKAVKCTTSRRFGVLHIQKVHGSELKPIMVKQSGEVTIPRKSNGNPKSDFSNIITIRDVASERECFGQFDIHHNFCGNICCIRFECERKSRKVN